MVAALLLVVSGLAAGSGIELATAKPAAAYALDGCTWGKAPVTVTYEAWWLGTDPAVDSGPVMAFVHQAADHISGQLTDRVKLAKGIDSQVPISIKLYVGNYGPSDSRWYGQWDPSAVTRYSDGSCVFHPRSTITLNLHYLYQYIGVRYSNVEQCSGCEHPPMVGHVALHEFGHSLGLDHTQGIHTHDPFWGESRCNTMYEYVHPFKKGNECEQHALYWKTDDRLGAEAAYSRYNPSTGFSPGCPKPFQGSICRVYFG